MNATEDSSRTSSMAAPAEPRGERKPETQTTDPAVPRAIEFLHTVLGGRRLPDVAFEFWDGTRWPDRAPRAATVRLKHPKALSAMFGGGDEKSLAEAFLRDDFDVHGDMESAVELAEVLAQRRRGDWLRFIRGLFQLHRMRVASGLRTRPESSGPQHSPARDRQVVSFHYDRSNDFFQLWLDSRMLYSCAYFEKPDDGIDTAQTAKLQHLCRKLRLQPGQRVLDIGCGWGGFALFAARNFGVHVTGVTLSQQQAALAAERVGSAGLAADVSIEVRDYRDLADEVAYDAIVSVGMSEHVGRKHLGGYFAKVGRMLKPGGVFLNHAIGEGVRPRGNRGPSFIEEHVFPDSDIPALPIVLAAAEGAGLEVRDVENLREHYLRTLRHWVARLEANRDQARNFVDESTYRVWRLYMAGSAHGFRSGQLAIYQALLSKPDGTGDSRLPLTRRDWYR